MALVGLVVGYRANVTGKKNQLCIALEMTMIQMRLLWVSIATQSDHVASNKSIVHLHLQVIIKWRKKLVLSVKVTEKSSWE